MVFGLPGPPGLGVARTVVVGQRKGPGHATPECPAVEGNNVLELVARMWLATNNAAVRLIFSKAHFNFDIL